MFETQEHKPGFQFDNFARNKLLASKGHEAPVLQKTGTTIAGVIYKDGVVLGADTRATAGPIVADKASAKLHYLQPNMYCGGAGTAADLELTTNRISSQLELLRLNTGREVPLIAAERMFRQLLFRYQGYIGAYLILGGVDKFGSHIYSISAHGSTMKLPYVAMGSGSLAAMSVIEMNWKPDMDVEGAKRLVKDAIASGITNDLGSGSEVNLCVITKDGANMLQRYEQTAVKGKRVGEYNFPPGTTKVLSVTRKPIDILSENVTRTEAVEPMETS